MTWAIEDKCYSQRRACGLVGLDPKTYRYAPRRADDTAVACNAARHRHRLGHTEAADKACRSYGDGGMDARDDIADISSLRQLRDDLDNYDKRAQTICKISSTCTVFAESEVISQLANATDKKDIIAGIHRSVAHRVTGLARRIGVQDDVVLPAARPRSRGSARHRLS